MIRPPDGPETSHVLAEGSKAGPQKALVVRRDWDSSSVRATMLSIGRERPLRGPMIRSRNRTEQQVLPLPDIALCTDEGGCLNEDCEDA